VGAVFGMLQHSISGQYAIDPLICRLLFAVCFVQDELKVKHRYIGRYPCEKRRRLRGLSLSTTAEDNDGCISTRSELDQQAPHSRILSEKHNRQWAVESEEVKTQQLFWAQLEVDQVELWNNL
jgi:hypothetical protein